jgi:hypothetical protein
LQDSVTYQAVKTSHQAIHYQLYQLQLKVNKQLIQKKATFNIGIPPDGLMKQNLPLWSHNPHLLSFFLPACFLASLPVS